MLDSCSLKMTYFRDQGPGLTTQVLLCGRVLLKCEKGQRKASDRDIRRGMESAHLTSQGLIHFYQTFSHNICFKITRLVRRRLLRINMSWNKIHCCYITCLSFSPPWKPWTPFSSLGTTDFLSTYLRIDSLKNMETVKGSVVARGIRVQRGMNRGLSACTRVVKPHCQIP